MLSRILKLAGLLVVVLLALVIAAPYFVPSSVYKERIETSAEQALGRDVTLTGDVKVRFFPRIEAVAGQAEIANPDGFQRTTVRIDDRIARGGETHPADYASSRS